RQTCPAEFVASPYVPGPMRRLRATRALAADVAAAMVALTAAFASVPAARAQTSARYDMKAHVVNEGGHPAQGVVLTSGLFRMSLDAVGQGLFAPSMGSAS